MKNVIKGLRLSEPVEFIYEFIAPRLHFSPIDEPVALHITCSSRHMCLQQKFEALARLCAKKVIIPEEVGCCGFAGAKGFTKPEVNRYALRKLRSQLEKAGVNYSLTHEDFMIGSKDLSIVGETNNGEKIQIFKDGEWAI